MYTQILSLGHYLPKNVVTNQELEKKIDTSDEWITKRTGINQRHIASVEESNVFMSHKAAEEAISKSGISAKDLDLIIVTTCTSDKAFPSTACLLQEKLGISHCPAFDLSAACSGFIYGLSVADCYIKSGAAKNILLVSTEIMSRVVNWEDRTNCILFGDGAAACVLTSSDKPGIISTHIHADGNYNDLLYVDKKYPSDKENADIYPYVKMAGKEVFKLAVNHLNNIVDETLAKNSLNKQDIDWLVPHQANLRIISATAKKLDMSMDKVVVTVDKHANTSAASVPLALYDAVNDGRIKRGDLLLLEAFGAGLTWGSALVRF